MTDQTCTEAIAQAQNVPFVGPKQRKLLAVLGIPEGMTVGELAEVVKLHSMLADDRHVVEFRDSGWTVAHPLRERLDLESLFACTVEFDHLDEPPALGRFYVDDDGAINEPVARRRAGSEPREARTGPRHTSWYHIIFNYLSAGLSETDLHTHVDIAMRSNVEPEIVWRYFCGVCRNEIGRRQEIARRMIEDGEEF